jgi:hypothetical protein
MRKITRGLAVAAMAVTAGGLSLGLAGTAHAAAPTSASAVTTLHARPDSGFSGDNWANDALTRTSAVTETAADTVLADCGAAAVTCFSYTGTISDTGFAFAVTGAVSPGAQAVPVKGTPSAVVTGAATVSFHSSSNAPDAALMPASLNGAGSAEQSTANWAEQFFPAGTTFGSGPVLPTWKWTYVDPADCQTWIDASSIAQAASGDITGVNTCPVLSGGHAVSTAPTREVVTWKQSGGAVNDETVITGPGPLNGHTGHVTIAQATISGAEPHHTYSLLVTPLYGGMPDGHGGRITFVTG